MNEDIVECKQIEDIEDNRPIEVDQAYNTVAMS